MSEVAKAAYSGSIEGGLDVAIEKANRLVGLLRESARLSDSLSGIAETQGNNY